MNHHYIRGIYVGGIPWFKLKKNIWLLSIVYSKWCTCRNIHSQWWSEKETNIGPSIIFKSNSYRPQLELFDPVNLCLPSFFGASGQRHDFEGRGPPNLSTETKPLRKFATANWWERFRYKGRLNANFQWRWLLIFGSVKHRERERERESPPSSWLPSMTLVTIAHVFLLRAEQWEKNTAFRLLFGSFFGATLYYPVKMTIIFYTPLEGSHYLPMQDFMKCIIRCCFFSLHFLGPSNYQTWRQNAYSWHQMIRLRIWRTLHTQKSITCSNIWVRLLCKSHPDM